MKTYRVTSEEIVTYYSIVKAEDEESAMDMVRDVNHKLPPAEDARDFVVVDAEAVDPDADDIREQAEERATEQAEIHNHPSEGPNK